MIIPDEFEQRNGDHSWRSDRRCRRPFKAGDELSSAFPDFSFDPLWSVCSEFSFSALIFGGTDKVASAKISANGAANQAAIVGNSPRILAGSILPVHCRCKTNQVFD